ncbi:PREDICTED: ATP-binding cassette sub-family C member 8-like [Priapulus caudatus]|uniref:ATP-binding cassette sub-family C member 8-like n=1 Tax=Priapulus caudatus TaxID=37621 RepID=A0ABM1EHD1_PRICU|nr:PREDICTED: ATP-binding cassette sub-family C member 8-like [Priapulus caudatus]
MMKLIDRNNTAALFVNAAKVWLGVRLGYLSAVVVLVAAVGAISFALACGATVHCASMVGLALTYAIVISDVFNWVVLNVAETEMQMSSVERVVHYCQLPTEPQAGTAGEIVPSADWPTTGTVQINNASIRYADTLPPVVKNINLYILPGQKVGVCGRTGSGKSSLLLMLLRLADVCEGHVLVDGVDIRTVPLADLRSRVSIIPQDPYLFSGTVR